MKQQLQDRQFTTNEVAALAKVSIRQLQWWDERRVVQPRHLGHRRVYERDDVVEVCCIADLRGKNLSLQKIRRALVVIRKAGDHKYLAVSGRNMRLLDSPSEVVAWMVKTYDGCVVVDVAGHVARVDQYANLGAVKAG